MRLYNKKYVQKRKKKKIFFTNEFRKINLVSVLILLQLRSLRCHIRDRVNDCCGRITPTEYELNL